MTWRFPRQLWGRSAGFPVSLERELCSQDAAEAAASLVQLRKQVADAERQLLDTLRTAGAGLETSRLRETRRIRRAIRAGRDVRPETVDLGATVDAPAWTAHVEAHRTARRALDAAAAEWRITLERARTRERQALRRILDAPRARDAAALSSRSMADGFARELALARPLSSGPATLTERRALLFVQRLAAKPAMMGDSGPCFWGTTDCSAAEPLHVESGPGLVRERRVMFEHWAIQALARRIQADPEVSPHCTVRLNPGCLLEGRTLFYPVGHRITVAPTEAHVLDLCRQGQTLGEIRRAIAARPDEDRPALETALSNYLTSGIADFDIPIPTIVQNPERFLRSFLETLPEACSTKRRWLEALDALERLRGQLEHGSSGAARRQLELQLDHGFREASGESPTRNPGKLHGARFVTYEDCSRDVDVRAGAALCRAGDDLQPVLDLASWVTRACADEFERRLLPIHSRLARGLDSVDFMTFTRESQHINESPEAVSHLNRLVQQAWRDHLGDRQRDGEPLSLEPDDFRAVLAKLEADADNDSEDASDRGAGSWVPATECHSLNILAASDSAEDLAAGRFTLILDKLYKGVPTLIHPAALLFCPSRQEVLDELDAWMREPVLQLVDMPGSYHRSNLNLPDVPKLIECVTPGAASRLPPDRVVPCSQVEVVQEDGHLFIASHDGSIKTSFFSLRWAFLQRKLLDVPIHPQDAEASRTKRVTLGRWVLTREQWKFDTEPLLRSWGDRRDPMVGVTAWKQQHDIPDRIFVRTSKEPKSVALDLRSALHAELLYAIAARSDGELRVTEMLPSPEQCWLADPDGQRYVSELRITAFRESTQSKQEG